MRMLAKVRAGWPHGQSGSRSGTVAASSIASRGGQTRAARSEAGRGSHRMRGSGPERLSRKSWPSGSARPRLRRERREESQSAANWRQPYPDKLRSDHRRRAAGGHCVCQVVAHPRSGRDDGRSLVAEAGRPVRRSAPRLQRSRGIVACDLGQCRTRTTLTASTSPAALAGIATGADRLRRDRSACAGRDASAAAAPSRA